MLELCSSIEEYSDLFNNSNAIVCFGAGKYANHIQELDSRIKCLDKIRCFIDNDNKKRKYQIAGKEFNVYPINRINELKGNASVVLITVISYFDILKQLEAYTKNDANIKICLLYHIFGLFQEEYALSRRIPANTRILDAPVIPKKIHYFWFGGTPIPEKYKKWIETWKKNCPDYEIIEWNEKNYDVRKNNYMYQAYQAKKWGFVPDYARLDVIYEYGGIYLDTDVELIAGLDDLLYQEAFACFEANTRVAFGLGFGARKGNHLIRELRDWYDNLSFINTDGSLCLKASPQIQTQCLLSKGLKQNGEYQIVDGMTIYPEKMLCGLSGATGRVRLTKYTRAIHHYEGTWVPTEVKKLWKMQTDLFR